MGDCKWLGHDKFVSSFTSLGFELKNCLFDVKCGGLTPLKPVKSQRLSPSLPYDHLQEHSYVIGNYFFMS